VVPGEEEDAPIFEPRCGDASARGGAAALPRPPAFCEDPPAMDALAWIGEMRIRAAAEAGQLDHLPLAGSPLDLSWTDEIPPELRGAWSVLKGGGYVPEEVELRRELVTLPLLLALVTDGDERTALQRQLDGVRMRYELLRERRSR
jgi:hypothetical protein